MKSIKKRIQVGNILISLMIKIIISKRVALCRRYHKAALIAEPDLTSGSRFFGIKNACGMESNMNIIIGALILVVVIAIYVTVSYFYGKDKGGNSGCNGNCAGCSVSCSKPAKKDDNK